MNTAERAACLPNAWLQAWPIAATHASHTAMQVSVKFGLGTSTFHSDCNLRLCNRYRPSQLPAERLAVDRHIQMPACVLIAVRITQAITLPSLIEWAANSEAVKHCVDLTQCTATLLAVGALALKGTGLSLYEDIMRVRLESSAGASASPGRHLPAPPHLHDALIHLRGCGDLPGNGQGS